MAPIKKPKSITKGLVVGYDSSPNKDDKSKHKKRKLSDMLGPQWSKRELQRFYEAYRKYGKTWKKVASAVRSRSTEMVESLYNMNRAYLSLPEGTASVSGLIAMMTDHYNVMDGSGSEKDSEDMTPMARKAQKHLKAKSRLDSKREISLPRQYISSSDKSIRGNSVQRPSISSNDRCLSLLKKFDAMQPNIPVRKRTPRTPVSDLDSHPNKKPRISVMNGNSDELSSGALFLSEVRQNPNSVKGPQTTYKSFEYFKNSQSSAKEKPKSSGFASDKESIGDSLGSYEARMKKHLRDSADSGSTLADYEKRKGKKKEGEISKAEMLKNIQAPHKFSDKRPRMNGGFASEGAKICSSPSENERMRNKKEIDEDELVACDALHTLADLSLMMPYLTTEPVEDAQEPVTLRDSTADMDVQCDVALQKSPSKKRKHPVSKARTVEQHHSDHSKKQAEKETQADEEVKSGDSSTQISGVAERCKLVVKSPDVPSSNGGHMAETKAVISSTQAQASTHVTTSMRRSRRKRDRTMLQKDRNHVGGISSSKSSSLLQDRVQCVKGKLGHCLSLPDVRRWCAYEWFYSAIDYPWFAKQEFVEYLNHVGLGQIPRLARAEWGVIRCSLGKPRRFSERFLHEERDKLEQYRESVRNEYANLRAGLGDGLPTDLAHPLSVGQQVVAIHPKTRELHNGGVLAVDRHSCLVQFDSQDLGVEFVMDIDCMPLNPVENMPELLRWQLFLFGQHSQLPKVNGTFPLASDEHMQTFDPFCRVTRFSQAISIDMKAKQVFMDSLAKIAGNGRLQNLEMSQSRDMVQMLPRNGDIKPIPCLTQDFDKKVTNQYCQSPGEALCWPHPVASSGGANGTLHLSDNSREEIPSNVVEIVEGSRVKAQKMVDVAVKVMSSMREDEDVYGRIGEAFDTSLKPECVTSRPTSSMMMSSNTVQGGLPPQNPVASFSQPQVVGDVSSLKPCASDLQVPSELSFEPSDMRVPSELITSCVATLLMIQNCTERQYPPAEVAQILDKAVSSLHPCCTQNLSIYREIQMCMGRIKTQILALVPTQS